MKYSCKIEGSCFRTTFEANLSPEKVTEHESVIIDFFRSYDR